MRLKEIVIMYMYCEPSSIQKIQSTSVCGFDYHSIKKKIYPLQINETFFGLRSILQG